AQNAGWDKEVLAIELQALVDLEFEVELTGFSLAEIDLVLDEARERSPTPACGPEDAIPDPGEGPAVTRPGDLWALGRHRLACGDARESTTVRLLMDGAQAGLIFTDPPYNVPIQGH